MRSLFSTVSHSLVALGLCCALSNAQDPPRQNVAPAAPRKNASEPAATAPFPFRPLAEWQGQRFIFLASPAASAQGTWQEFIGKRRRQDYAGRIVKVVAVSDFSGRAHVEFTLEDNGESLRARTLPHKESLEGLLLVADLEAAQKTWTGQTLWSRQLRLSTYDAASDALGSLAIKRYAPLKVVEITPGWDAEKPLRFVLETADGRRGFVDVNLSGTNVPPELRQLNRFADCFLTEDPRLTRKWPAGIWAAIESNRIVTGMTMEQVKMSWGEPDKTARTATGEQWTYAAGVLSFKNGVLVNWQ